MSMTSYYSVEPLHIEKKITPGFNFIYPDKKIFVGGLYQKTKEEDIEKYFSTYGKVSKVQLMYDKKKKESRRFGFVIMDDQNTVNDILRLQPHFINNKQIECKLAYPKYSDNQEIKNETLNLINEKNKDNEDLDLLYLRKMFVGGLNKNIGERDLVEFFIQFGKISECFIKRKHDVSRGFGFIIFVEAHTLSKVLNYSKKNKIIVKNCEIECRNAIPRNDYLEKIVINSNNFKSINNNILLTTNEEKSINNLYEQNILNEQFLVNKEQCQRIFNEVLIFNTNLITIEAVQIKNFSKVNYEIDNNYFHLLNHEFYLEDLINDDIKFNEEAIFSEYSKENIKDNQSASILQNLKEYTCENRIITI